MKPLFLASLTALTLLTAACQPADTQSTARSGQVVSTGKAAIGGPYTLTDHNGESVSEKTYLGKPQLIYFGFSYCPDVCPMALQQMGAALDVVDPKGDYFQPLFFSVDPERDTPESLKQYVTANGFPKNLIGLTGTQEQVDAAKEVYKIYAQKVEDASSTAGYTMDHASLIYLMDDRGDFVNVFTHSSTVPDIISGLENYKKSRG